MKLAITIRHVTTDIAEKVFKVSGQRSLYWRDHYNGGGMRFDGVAKRLTRFIAFCRIHFIPYKDTKNTKKILKIIHYNTINTYIHTHTPTHTKNTLPRLQTFAHQCINACKPIVKAY